MRQHPEFGQPEFALAGQLFRQAGAHNTGIDLAVPDGIDDAVHRQADKAQFLEIVLRVDALAQHFAGGQQVAAKCIRIDGSHPLACQIADHAQIVAVGPGEDDRAQRFGGRRIR